MACFCSGACRKPPYTCASASLGTIAIGDGAIGVWPWDYPSQPPGIPIWPPHQEPTPTMGWICPRCQRVHAPTGRGCICEPEESPKP